MASHVAGGRFDGDDGGLGVGGGVGDDAGDGRLGLRPGALRSMVVWIGDAAGEEQLAPGQGGLAEAVVVEDPLLDLLDEVGGGVALSSAAVAGSARSERLDVGGGVGGLVEHVLLPHGAEDGVAAGQRRLRGAGRGRRRSGAWMSPASRAPLGHGEGATALPKYSLAAAATP